MERAAVMAEKEKEEEEEVKEGLTLRIDEVKL